MIEKLIRFFLKRQLLTNLIFVSVILGGVLAWINIPKEELPDITFDRVRIRASYPGASAEDVEYYVTEPIEEVIRGLDGVYRVFSSTGPGNASITADLEQFHPDKESVINEIRSEVLSVRLPAEVIDRPTVRVFKTSRRPVIDIGLIYTGRQILDVPSRGKLQQYALNLENQLMALGSVSRVDMSGYLKKEIHVSVIPDKLREFNVPFNVVMREIRDGNVRQPAGNIENIDEPRVTLAGELDSAQEIAEMSVQGGFEGGIIRVSDLAHVENAFEKPGSILKINGHEGIFLRVAKNSQYGIVEAVEEIKKAVSDFEKDVLKDKDISVVILDDESFDVRNRLKLIGLNGLIGFSMILVILFIFMDLKSAVWVAMGIPFTFCFTIIGGLAIGYSVNNITLAAIIIVMGMVVDDAIVVAENIDRSRKEGGDPETATIRGVSFVFLPVVASILTTCMAFVPLFFFGARFGTMVRFIPAVIFLMLGGSLFEALFILPGHITHTSKGNGVLRSIKARMGHFLSAPFRFFKDGSGYSRGEWVEALEKKYERVVGMLLRYKALVFAGIALVSFFSFITVRDHMRFVMFPDEETREIRLFGETPPGTTRYRTAELTQQIEDMLMSYKDRGLIGLRSHIARTRRGSAAQENNFRMRIEITPREDRDLSADDLIEEWAQKIQGMPDISWFRMSKTWHGQEGESPIEIMIKENDNSLRYSLAEDLAQALREHKALQNVEIDRPMYTPEYRLTLNRDTIRRLAINPSDIARTLRAALEGTVLYEFRGPYETVYTRLTVVPDAKDDIEKIFDIPIENRGQYLVPLRDLVSVEKVETPDSIIREDLRRSTTVYADIKPGSGVTPLEIAAYFESSVFPGLRSLYPTSILEFRGEVKDARETAKDFNVAVIMSVALIYIILALLFNSLLKPFIIMMAIPFGVMGIILAFRAHGMDMFGFFAVIGALGLSGVVVNDSIIMLSKLDGSFDMSKSLSEKDEQIAAIAKTRFRAVILTTLTTVVAIIPTAYGWAGYDSMLAQMMLGISWGLLFATVITLVIIPCVYSVYKGLEYRLR